MTQRNQHRALVIRRGCAGLGLFTEKEIKEGDFIISYTGTVIPTDEADALKTRYLFEIDERYTVDGKSHENLARYMNHFCKPNVEALVEAGRINFYALRDIAQEEELGYDYGEEYFNEFIKPSKCRCPVCTTTAAGRSAHCA